MKFPFAIVAMLAALVVGSPTPNLANERDSAEVELSPVLSDIEMARVMFNDALKRQEPQGCDNHYMIECGDIVKSYNCWYWNKTRCRCGKLTSQDPTCLSDCNCTHWKEGNEKDHATSLPIDAPASDNTTSNNNLAPARNQKAPAGDDVN